MNRATFLNAHQPLFAPIVLTLVLYYISSNMAHLCAVFQGRD